MGRFIKQALAVAVVAAALGALAVTGPAAQRTYVAGNCSNAVFKPKQIVLACADAGFLATELSWSRWGQKQAKGTGTGKVKICKPDCAAGHFNEADIQVRLYQPRYCSQDSKRHFTKVEYIWLHGVPGGGEKQGTVPLPCALL